MSLKVENVNDTSVKVDDYGLGNQMGLGTRQLILDTLNADGEMLEWGSGATTVWMLDHMTENQSLTSVEHVEDWHQEVSQKVTDLELHPKHTYLLRTDQTPLRDNHGELVNTYASPLEETPAGFNDYINPGLDLDKYQVILVDGIARGACLARVCMFAREDAVVLLHDIRGRENWYGWATELYQSTEYLTPNLLRLYI